MITLRFVTLDPEFAALIEDWFDDDDTVRYVGGLAWLRTTLRFERPDRATSSGDPSSAHHAWLALVGDHPVALVDVLTYDDGTAAMKMTVAPARRKMGLGRQVLDEVWRLPEMAGVAEIIGSVDPNHHPARRLAESAGFAIVEDANSESEILYRKHRPPGA